jgi:hypothetical protein
MPVIMAGIRTSAVWVIGTATLATPIGQTSLGNYIFAGLQTQNWVFVIFGCVAAAALALVVDFLLAQMERGVALRSRARIWGGGLGVAHVVLAALAPGFGAVQGTYVVGTKSFTEQYVLGALIQQRLAANGLSSERRDGLGSAVLFKALTAGDVDVYVDYSGTIWANYMKRSDVKPREVVLADVAQWLKETYGIRMLGDLGFENAYALAMPRKKAEALGIDTIADLARHSAQMTIGGDYEFFDRPEWKAIRNAYGLRFKEQRSMQTTYVSGRRQWRRRCGFGVLQRRPDRQIRPQGAGRSEAADPALRRHHVDRPRARHRPKARRRTQAFDWRHSGRHHAGSQFTRVIYRRFAGESGAMAMRKSNESSQSVSRRSGNRFAVRKHDKKI